MRRLIRESHRDLRHTSFALLLCSTLLWANTSARASDGCQVQLKSPCQLTEPWWFKDWEGMCQWKCGEAYMPQENPWMCDYHTTGCGDDKMVWESWCWCVVPPPAPGS